MVRRTEFSPTIKVSVCTDPLALPVQTPGLSRPPLEPEARDRHVRVTVTVGIVNPSDEVTVNVFGPTASGTVIL